MEITIIRADQSHASIINDIELQCFSDSYSLEQITNDLMDIDKNYIFVGYLDDKCIGYASYSVVVGEAELIRIAILPEYRKQGCGTKLLNDTYKIIDCIAEVVFLEVSEDNIGAIKMYTDFGFVPISTRKGYYKDGSNAIIMQKKRKV